MTPMARWTVRTRSTVAAAVVMTLGVVIAATLLLVVLYRGLEHSTRSAADARAAQIASALPTEDPTALDASLLATDSQVGFIQVVDRHGRVLAGSAATPPKPISDRQVPVSAVAFIGRVDDGVLGDFWVTAHGSDSNAGPVTVLVGGDREPVEAVIRRVGQLLAVGAPLLVALVAIATHRLVGASLRPVEQLRARVSEISMGRLNERVPVPPSGDEIAHLAETMNDMLARLDAAHTAQRRFVSDASHELRSPLATITTALELAQSRPEMIDAALIDDALLPESRRMRELLDDLLLLARADERALPMRIVDVDVDDLMRAEAARVRSLGGITVGLSAAPVRVRADAAHLTRLLRNLVDNGARHARSKITLTCRLDGAVAVIEVADDGPGVPVSERQRVFDRFVRLDDPRTRRQGGTGLGLAIVAEIAAAHHGSVTIVDRAGGGAQFEVRLPAQIDSYLSAEDTSR